MSLRQLPEAKTFARPQNFQWDAPSDVLTKWSENPLAAVADDPDTITIYEVIGEDYWSGGGFTAKRMSGALRAIGAKPVTVKINSPGGDMFEGIAIYNLLREHPAKVTIDVMGWAASAASIIAMAGDEIRMGLGTFMMVHNAWGVVIGNRHDMRDAATMFDGFDAAIVDIYAARTGGDRKAIAKLMDAETFMGPSQAVKEGFADVVAEDLTSDAGDANNAADRGQMARRKTEAALARAGFSRTARAELITELLDGSAPRDASGSSKSAPPRDARRNEGDTVSAVDLANLLSTIRST
jgi:ATP-dependent protease ClpP protease subunit